MDQNTFIFLNWAVLFNIEVQKAKANATNSPTNCNVFHTNWSLVFSSLKFLVPKPFVGAAGVIRICLYKTVQASGIHSSDFERSVCQTGQKVGQK